MNNTDRAFEYMFKEHSSPLNHIMHQASLQAEVQYHKDIETAFRKGAEWKGKCVMDLAVEWLEDNFNSFKDGGVLGVFDSKESMIEEFKEAIVKAI